MRWFVPKCQICARSPLTYLGTLWVFWVVFAWDLTFWRTVALGLGGQLLAFVLNHAIAYAVGDNEQGVVK